MSNYKRFETERLLIRPTNLSDGEFVIRLLNSPGYLKYVGDRNVKNLKDAKNFIRERILKQLKRLGYANYTIIRKSDNSKIGVCGLYDREGIDGVDIGFALLTEFENNGYAFEAANRIMKVAIEEFKLKTIKAITLKNNFASQKLLEKLGLKFISFTKIPNDDEELMLYEFSSKIEKGK